MYSETLPETSDLIIFNETEKI